MTPEERGVGDDGVIEEEFLDRIYDGDVLVERAVHVPTMLAMPAPDLWNDIEDDLATIARLLGFDVDLQEAGEAEELGWVLRSARGWLVQVSVAMVGPWSEGPMRSRAVYGGRRILRWWHADTYENALRQAVEWVDSDPAEMVWSDA